MSYDCAVIFKKFTNLMPYFNGLEGNTPAMSVLERAMPRNVW